MSLARVVVTVLIVLTVVIAYSPQMHEQAVKIWDEIEPAVAGFTNSLYLTIYNLVVGNHFRDGGDETPVPDPGVRFDRVVTRNISAAF